MTATNSSIVEGLFSKSREKKTFALSAQPAIGLISISSKSWEAQRLQHWESFVPSLTNTHLMSAQIHSKGGDSTWAMRGANYTTGEIFNTPRLRNQVTEMNLVNVHGCLACCEYFTETITIFTWQLFVEGSLYLIALYCLKASPDIQTWRSCHFRQAVMYKHASHKNKRKEDNYFHAPLAITCQ